MVRYLFSLAFALSMFGCDPAPSATPDASKSNTSTPAATETKPAETKAAETKTPEAKPAEPQKEGGSTASTAKKELEQLFNKDGSHDKDLPDTAGWGCKTPAKGDPIVILETTAGRIVVKFFPDRAPKHVENFTKLAGKGFYDGTKFHRVIPNFMIQGGDPNTKTDNGAPWGTGGPGYSVKAEFNDIPHVRGILSMARSQDPDSAGSQFFIMHQRTASLDGQYSVFGEAIEGMDVVDKIVSADRDQANGDRPYKPVMIKKATVTKWPIELKK